MTSPHQPERDSGKAEGNAEDLSPMERFRSLARSLIGVTPEQVREQDRKNRERKLNKIEPLSR